MLNFLTQPWQPVCCARVQCCNLLVGIVLNVRFTTNAMCAKNTTHIYVVRTSNIRVIMACDLCCCLLLQCEPFRTCRSGFPIAKNGAVTRMWRSCQVQPSQKELVIGAVQCKRRRCCCYVSVGVVLKVQFTTNGMCVKIQTHRCMAWTSNIRVIMACGLYCCLLPVWSFAHLPLRLYDCNNSNKFLAKAFIHIWLMLHKCLANTSTHY